MTQEELAALWEQSSPVQEQQQPTQEDLASLFEQSSIIPQEGDVLPEGTPIPEGYTTYQDPMLGSILQKVKAEPTLGEKVLGAGETALTLGTGATAGAVGYIGGILSGLYEDLASGKFGTDEGAQMVKKAAEEMAAKFTYEPRTQTGQEYTQAVGETLEPLAALGPLGQELEIAGRGAIATSQATKTSNAMPKSISATEAVRQAEQSGITPMTSDIFAPKTFVGKTIQAMGERIPVVGTGPVRAAQQEQRASAIKSFLNEYGQVGNESIIDDVMKSLTKAREDKITKFSNLKKDVFSRVQGIPVDTTKTISIIDTEISRLRGMETKGVRPLIDILEDYKVAFKNKDIDTIEALRKQLGDQLDAPDLTSVSTEAGKSSKNIYMALNEDIGDFIKANGDAKDFNKWKVANRNLSETIGELQNNTLKSVLNKGQSTPEDVKKLLFSRKPSEIKLIYKNLNKEGRDNARSAILHEAMQKAGGIESFTPEKFLTSINKLENSTGIFFRDGDKAALNGLTKALELTKQAGVAGVKPITGAELTLPVGAAVLTDLLGGAGAGIATAGGIGSLSRLYESKPVRNLLIRLSQTPKAKQMPVYNMLIAEIQSQQEGE